MTARATLLFALGVAACGDPTRHVVDKDDFLAVTTYVDKSLRTSSADERRKYTAAQLGGAHRTDGDVAYWYTSERDCYYLQLGLDGWASWGPGVTSDCKKYAVKK